MVQETLRIGMGIYEGFQEEVRRLEDCRTAYRESPCLCNSVGKSRPFDISEIKDPEYAKFMRTYLENKKKIEQESDKKA